MTLMPITDSMFLMLESREHPMHVGALQLFDLPDGADQGFLTDLRRWLVTSDAGIDPPFDSRPQRSVSSFGQWAWSPDENLDLEYHVRLWALPHPGRVSDLLELVSLLHGSLLDRYRPLWEMHLIGGVDGGRFAVYTKVHHGVNDGVSALRRLVRTLSDDPHARGLPAPWGVDSASGGSDPGAGSAVTALVAGSMRVAGAAARGVADLLGIPTAVLGAVRDGFGDAAAVLPLQPPRSMFNVPITGARRFAVQSWPLERLHAVRAATDATVNDVVLAMSAGALRRYLLDFDALPDRSLVAMVPVSIRSGAANGGSGNAFGTILCDLGTDTADPTERYSRILRSMQQGKQLFDGLTPLQITALSAVMCAPLAAALLPGATGFVPPPFNVIISNIPGPTTTMYWECARLREMYPMSLLLEGQTLNITVTTYDGNLQFGLTGCRRSVPELHRLITHLETSLTELEVATYVDHQGDRDRSDQVGGGR